METDGSSTQRFWKYIADLANLFCGIAVVCVPKEEVITLASPRFVAVTLPAGWPAGAFWRVVCMKRLGCLLSSVRSDARGRLCYLNCVQDD
jgi:hypothetical protein